MASKSLALLLVALLLAVTINALATYWSERLQQAAADVYRGQSQCPRMHWARPLFFCWFAGSVAMLLVLFLDSPLTLGLWLAWLALLGLLGLIDAHTGLLPNELNLALMVSGLAWHCVAVGSLMPPAEFAWGMVVGWFLPYAMNRVHERWRGTMAIGEGDAKLLAGIGAWLGVEALPLVWVIASLVLLAYTALVYVAGHGRVAYVTFGPFLAVGASSVMLLNHV